ncbi:agarase [Wenyingzhuangia heitensis]|uniref:Agarase n=1 Tax=Wenyingzhuangia heitensis TaxID=1487859 RepID=A0ABX0U7Y2_9FLAO|nr:agarase [Wenyingzhuangia heitensis]NIJ44858.1 agarase [Wenyingzhuangia heitensis]
MKYTLVLVALVFSFNSFSQDKKSVWDGQKQIELFDFENKKDIKSVKTLTSKIEISNKKGVTKGSKALTLFLKGDEKLSGIDIKPKKVLNSKGLKDFCFVFDATNLTNVSANVDVEVHSSKGGVFRRMACMPANSSETYYFELEGKDVEVENGLRNNPPAWKSKSFMMANKGARSKVDFSQISKIRMSIRSAYEDKIIVIDNIRLVESPERDPNYLIGFVDKFGQNAKVDFPLKISSDNELKKLADIELKYLATSKPMDNRSKFGGWKEGPQLQATGYFRAQKYKGKWALVDPEGYLFFSSGIANVRMANSTTFTGMDYKNEAIRHRDPEDVTPEDSKNIVAIPNEIRKTAYKAYPGRRDMFVELPSYDDPLANHYSYRRESHKGNIQHGETFSFYRANLERRYGEQFEGSYLMKWRDVTLDRMLDWGFTSFGNWAGEEFYGSKRLPYFANTWVIGDFKTIGKGEWHNMGDPFDPEFARRAKYSIDIVADQVKNNPWCVGVFVDNEKSWGSEGSFRSKYILALDALEMDETSLPIKGVYMRFLKDKYKTAKALSKAWKVNIDSWNTLSKGISFHNAKKPNKTMAADMGKMVEIYADKYFQIVHDALKEQLPNHLYLGCRFTSWGMTAEVRKAAKKYVDVFSFNYYREAFGKKFWSFMEEFDMPAMIGEFHYGATSDSGIPYSGLQQASDQSDRARLYKQYMNEVIDNPYFVGAHWFQYFDSSITGRAHDGENCNIGFVTITDRPYLEMVKAAKEVHKNMYERKYGETKK